MLKSVGLVFFEFFTSTLKLSKYAVSVLTESYAQEKYDHSLKNT